MGMCGVFSVVVDVVDSSLTTLVVNHANCNSIFSYSSCVFICDELMDGKREV